METDARTLHDDERIEADLCIIGAGPAGLVLARALRGQGAQVVILESGGKDIDSAAQELNAGRTTGDPFGDLRHVRHRRIGGAVNIWNTPIDGNVGAKYVPLDAVDFEERHWIPHSGWPFGRSLLELYYQHAQTICGLGPFDYEAARWTGELRPPLPLHHGLLATRVYQFGSARPFLQTYCDDVARSTNVRLVHHATVGELASDAAGERVRSANVRVANGNRFSVYARTFVLAAGAIENARLLLLSDHARREGLGNRFGWIGRCFMEHPRDYALTLRLKRGTHVEEVAFYDMHRALDGTTIMGRLAPLSETLRSERIAQFSVTLLPASSHLGARLLTPLRKAFDVAGVGWPWRYGYPRSPYGWSASRGRWRRPDAFRLLCNLEQFPHADNRIVLGPDRDSFGLPKVHLHWRWWPEDGRSLERIRAMIKDQMEAAGLGRVETAAAMLPDANAHHHAGTTRIHADPRLGVVDASLRVHDTENLYVVGASVFPTAGFANPTLTVVALALRLADHLKSVVAQAP